jgi:RES domain-containing protein
MSNRDWKTLLVKAPKVSFKTNLVRCIAKSVFDGGNPPSYLFTSGKPGRCNPRGVLCLYISEDRITALAEYDKYYTEPQPLIAFYGHLKAEAIIDLGDSATQMHFGFMQNDFYDGYRLKPQPTPLQYLGMEISRQLKVAGIRFPSAACHESGAIGHNFVVYRNSFSLPDSLKILGEGRTILEQWP